MARKTDTKTLIETMRILARDIHSEDLVANAAISEAADRLEELQAQHRKDVDEYAKLWQMYGDLEEERDRLRKALVDCVSDMESSGAAWSDPFGYETTSAYREARAALKEVDDD